MPDFLQIDQQKLKYSDALTLLTIRSHNNTNRAYAHPSYERLAEVSGLGRTFIVQSVKRLEQAGFLHITHSKRQGRCNRYHFGKLDHFERIPPALLQVKELSTYEKAMLICLRQFFNHGLLQSAYRVSEFAKFIGIGYRAVDRQFKSLMAKGYISEKINRNKRGEITTQSYLLTDKIDWKYEYTSVVSKPSLALLMVA